MKTFKNYLILGGYPKSLVCLYYDVSSIDELMKSEAFIAPKLPVRSLLCRVLEQIEFVKKKREASQTQRTDSVIDLCASTLDRH